MEASVPDISQLVIRGDGEVVTGRDGSGGRKMATIKFDFFYRTEEEDSSTSRPPQEEEEEFQVMWERKNRLFEKNGHAKSSNDGETPKAGNNGETEKTDSSGEESEEDPDITTYIQDFMTRKKKGGNVSGEFIYYDESLCCVRNMHSNSYSLTEYAPINYKDFGRGKTMRLIMTPEEKAMLGVPVPSEAETELG